MTQEQTDQVFVIEDRILRSLSLRSLREGLFGSILEEGLQKLIEQYPQIIPGAQMDPGSEDPPRFVLLCREMPIGSWSLDFLLVDQYSIPTLVEAKLVENPESRRAVVGQIMEYAANAADAWGEGRLRQKAVEYWGKRGRELDEVLCELFQEDDFDADAFWSDVEENLRRGKIRLIIATDELKPEVRRTIEYLNTETRNAEILGLEIRCYGEDKSSLVLVPRLVGQSQTTATRKALASKSKIWSFAELQARYQSFPDSVLGERFSQVLEWARECGALIESRTQSPTFGLKGRSGKRIISFWQNGIVYCVLNAQQYGGDAKERDRFIEKLNSLPIFDYDPTEVVDGRNSLAPLNNLSKEDYQAFLKILEEFCVAERKM